MAKVKRHNAKGRTEGAPRFLQIPYWVLESPAAIALSPSAFKVLVYLLKRHNGVNNGKIGFGARSGCFVNEPGGRGLRDTPIGLGTSATGDALCFVQPP